MTLRAYADYLRGILDAIAKIQRFVPGVTVQDFVQDDEKTYAVVLALEIIGEAAKQIPESERKRYTQIPWREIAGMRDKIAHPSSLILYKNSNRDEPCSFPQSFLSLH